MPAEVSVKSRVRRLLKSPDLVFDSPALDAALAGLPLKAAAHALLGALASPEEETRWRAVALLGRAAALLAGTDLEAGREVARRLLWSLNEESGTMGWGAAEALAETMAQHEGLGREYVNLFLSHIEPGPKLLDHPALAAGAWWGVVRLLRKRPELLDADRLAELARPLAASQDSNLRSLALQALSLTRPAQAALMPIPS